MLIRSTTWHGDKVTNSPVSAFWPEATSTFFGHLFCQSDSCSRALQKSSCIFCSCFLLSYNFKPVMRIFLFQACETLFKLSKTILPLFVVVEKIDGARRESLYVLLDSCQRYYQGIKGILCLIESAYKAIGFLKEKKQLMIF